MKLNYQEKEEIMQKMFVMHNSPIGFRSVYKGIPIYNYEGIKQFIDFTKYFVMFRPICVVMCGKITLLGLN